MKQTKKGRMVTTPVWECSFCAKKFQTKAIARMHEIRKHNRKQGEQKMIVFCSLCGKRWNVPKGISFKCDCGQDSWDDCFDPDLILQFFFFSILCI